MTGAYVTSADNITNASSYSFASTSLGAADADRRIHVVIQCRRVAPSATVTAVTIAGVSATLDVATTDQGSTTEIWSAAVPTGTTGTIAVTLDAIALRCHIHVYRTVGADAIPAGTETPTSAQTGTFSTASVNGGFVIYATSNSAAAATVTWTGATQDGALAAEYATCVASVASVGTPTAVTAAWSSASSVGYAHAAVAYEPA